MLIKIKSYLGRFRRVLSDDGLPYAVDKTVEFLQAHSGLVSRSAKRRIALSRRISRKLGGVVRYGPLAGLKIRLESTWGAGDRGGMLLGLYEREVADVIAESLRDRSTFIDIGAADGYYAVGVLKAGLAEQSIAFEMNPKARASIAALASLNNVSDRLTIHGAADAGSLASLSAGVISGSFEHCVVLCDIEGAETEVLNDRALALLSHAVIVVELHRSGTLTDVEVGALLRARAEAWFDIESFTVGARSPLQIEEIAQYSEDDQWLICSEGRGYRQTWFVLRPKA